MLGIWPDWIETIFIPVCLIDISINQLKGWTNIIYSKLCCHGTILFKVLIGNATPERPDNVHFQADMDEKVQ